MKICIPTKNRVGEVKTIQFFKNKDIILFVEPQDYVNYVKVYPNIQIVNIEKNDQGISYVRRYICNYMGPTKFIMSDDDLVALSIRKKVKGKKFDDYDKLDSGYKIVDKFKELLKKHDACTIPFSGFCRLIEDKVYVDCRPLYCFFAIDNKKMQEKKLYFDSYFYALEDIEFSIRVILSGLSICSDYGYSMTTDARFKPGGCSAIYKKHGKSDMYKRLGEKYGEKMFIKRHAADGTPSWGVNWKNVIKQRELNKKQ